MPNVSSASAKLSFVPVWGQNAPLNSFIPDILSKGGGKQWRPTQITDPSTITETFQCTQKTSDQEAAGSRRSAFCSYLSFLSQF